MTQLQYTTKLDGNSTKLGLPQAVETLDELQYFEYDKDNYAEFGMLMDNMEDLDDYEN